MSICMSSVRAELRARDRPEHRQVPPRPGHAGRRRLARRRDACPARSSARASGHDARPPPRPSRRSCRGRPTSRARRTRSRTPRGPTVRSDANVRRARLASEAAAAVEVADERRVEAVEQRDAGEDAAAARRRRRRVRSVRRGARPRPSPPRRRARAARGPAAAAQRLVLVPLRLRDGAADALRPARDDDVVDGVGDDERLREPAEVTEAYREPQQRLLHEADDQEEQLRAEHGDAAAARAARSRGRRRGLLAVPWAASRPRRCGSSDEGRPVSMTTGAGIVSRSTGGASYPTQSRCGGSVRRPSGVRPTGLQRAASSGRCGAGPRRRVADLDADPSGASAMRTRRLRSGLPGTLTCSNVAVVDLRAARPPGAAPESIPPAGGRRTVRSRRRHRRKSPTTWARAAGNTERLFGSREQLARRQVIGRQLGGAGVRAVIGRRLLCRHGVRRAAGSGQCQHRKKTDRTSRPLALIRPPRPTNRSSSARPASGTGLSKVRVLCRPCPSCRSE